MVSRLRADALAEVDPEAGTRALKPRWAGVAERTARCSPPIHRSMRRQYSTAARAEGEVRSPARQKGRRVGERLGRAAVAFPRHVGRKLPGRVSLQAQHGALWVPTRPSLIQLLLRCLGFS